MKPKDVFGIVVRTIGLVGCLITGSLILYAAFILVVGGPEFFLDLAAAGFPAFWASLWLLRRAESVIEFAYNMRPLQFSLRSLLIAMTIAALLLATAGIVLNR